VSLATKLKALRSAKGQSLQQVADGVGVSKAHIWELERGNSGNPGLELLRSLASHFNVTIAYLTDDAATPAEGQPLAFFRDFEGKLSEQDWAVLRSVADRLKDKEPGG
jgi:transcriptional regulator with XRE-family HTH domain